jgi:hypothetical protein
MEVKSLQAQVVRGKENQELLRGQLAEVQVEVDVIYEVRPVPRSRPDLANRIA